NDGAPNSAQEKDQLIQKTRRANKFVNWTRESQIQAFLTRLPKTLHDAPGIVWAEIPPEVMGYCIHTIGNSPDAEVLAVIAVAVHGAMESYSQRDILAKMNRLFRTLRLIHSMQSFADLRQEHIWYEWAASHKRTAETTDQVKAYSAVATGHLPHYLLRLNTVDRQRMQQYVLPPFPPDITKKHFAAKPFMVAQQAKRKSQTDILVPLYPVLRQLVRFRKQLAERTITAIREARRKVEADEAVLPFHFQHIDTIPEINRNARSVSEVQIQGREVTMPFILWDRKTWVEHHPKRYSEAAHKEVKMETGAYAPGQNTFFVQFDGNSADLLWIGELVEHRLFQHFTKQSLHLPSYRDRWELARKLGFTNGCACSRPGLLNAGHLWLTEVGHQNGDLVFEPEALYRAVLFGATLAMIALSNGSRASELLQVSWNKERRIIRTETIMLLNEHGQPQMGENQTPLTKQVKLHFQHLLPKGAKAEEERQLFPLSKEALRLVGEIKTLLEVTHGEVPVVYPSRTSAKYEHLKPERYIFQWAASPDDTLGILTIADIQVLLRFMLHGLDLYTTQGEPIRVSVHVLRHVMATHARQYRKVPPEAIAYFFLHHRLKELTGQVPSLSEISEYYTLMTEEQRFAVIRADLDEQEELDHALLQSAPTPRDLEQMNADLQAVFELWHALHPTALGNCGCPGLCPRGNDRALCLGCSYLVTDPERMGVALSWRTSYAKRAELLEAQGNFIDARQARIKVQQLNDVINVMRLQLQAEADGSYIPLHKVLPSPYLKREEGHEEAR
ncbi:MAG TPA: hypothetical protein VFV38_01755, partial [Ktedonobacteraceae bacterium]|nr:hypothetical protein [Ktedonobacteraceae bacterium]